MNKQVLSLLKEALGAAFGPLIAVAVVLCGDPFVLGHALHDGYGHGP